VVIVLVLAFWIGLSVVVAIAASAARRNGFTWFIVSVMISPLLAALLLFVTSERGSREQSDGG
jgi:hypothetical protein